MKVDKIILLIFLLVTACAPSIEEQVTSTVPAATATSTTPNFTETPEPTFTPTETSAPTATLTPTIVLSPTITSTPTFVFPSVTVNKQAHCRYGPSAAYLH